MAGASLGVSYQRLIHGLTRIRDHCLFAWTETIDSRPVRTYELASDHCDECTAQLRALHPGATFVQASSGMSDGKDDAIPTRPRPRPGAGRRS